MVKIFIGNLPDGGLVKNEDVRPLFEAHGTVTECEVIKNYGWVKLVVLSGGVIQYRLALVSQKCTW